MIGKKWYTCECVVCKNTISQNRHEILQPDLFVCWNCMENARQMLAIKAFAKEVNVKIDFRLMSRQEVEKFKETFNVKEG